MPRLNSAFTLLEVMVATGIFALVVGALLLVFIGNLSLNAISKNLTISINGAQAKLEEIYQQDFETLVINYGPGGNPGNNFSITDLARPHSGIISVIDDGSDEPDHLTNSNLTRLSS